MGVIVQKFGGAALASPDHIAGAARRIVDVHRRGARPAVVTSAVGRTTDELLALASTIAPGAAPRRRREVDALLATGEQVAAALLALAIEERGVPAVSLTGAQAEVLTDGNHGSARIRDVRARRVRRALDEGRVAVVAGFQGVSGAREVTTLGRGGSDTTAVALAAALDASRCDIYTDVDGIYTADPRAVPAAACHMRLAHREAVLLAHAGAAVLHPRAAALAATEQMPLHVLPCGADHSNSGTRIEGESVMEGPHVLGVAAAADAARFVLHDPSAGAAAAARLLNALAGAAVPVHALDDQRTADGERRLCAIVPADRAAEAEHAAIDSMDGGEIRRRHPVSRVTVVGTGLSDGGVVADALDDLLRAGIEPEGVGVTDLGLTLYVAPEHEDAAVRLLHASLIEDGPLSGRAERNSAGKLG